MSTPLRIREHLNRSNYRYLFLTLAAMIFMPFFFPDSFIGKTTFSGLFTIVLLISLNLSDPKSLVFKMKAGLFFLSITLTWFNIFTDHTISTIAAVGSYFLFFGLVGRTLFYSIKSAPEVDVDVITGAISGYLILGIFFYFLLGSLYSLDPGHFKFPSESHSMKDMYYFTLVSMTTLGYGEITPASYPAKGFSLMLTLAGQLYLTVVIATLIGKFLNKSNHRKE